MSTGIAVEERKPKLNPSPNPYLLTVRQASERLQLGVNCVYGLAKAEHDPIPTLTVGRSIRIPVAALERWLEAQTRG